MSRTATPAVRIRMASAILAAGLFLFPALQRTAEAANGVTIEIADYSFTPSEVTVAPGTTVIWVNRDDSPHTIISTDHRFDSKAMDTGDQYSFTFEEEGDYGYVCSLHPYMAGTVKVRRP